MPSAVTREIEITYGSVAINSVAAGTGVYTLEEDAPPWLVVGTRIRILDCSSGANNGTFNVTGVAGTTLTTDNTSSVLEASDSPGIISLLLNADSEYQLNNRIRINKGYTSIDITFDIFFTSTSEAVFERLASTLEEAFREPRGRFRVVQGSTVLVDLDPVKKSGGNTGFNAETNAAKTGEEFDTGRSRQYEVQVIAELPATLPGQKGRRDSTVQIDFDESRKRTVTINGSWTAIDDKDVTENYEDEIDAYATIVLDAITGTYELIGEQTTRDETDKVINFSRTYLEVVFNQSSGSLDHPAIKNHSISFNRSRPAPGDTQEARRMIDVTATFDSAVDINETTNLEQLWKGTIRPHILGQAKSIFAPQATALIDDNVNLDAAGNRISAVLTFQMVDTDGIQILEHRLTQECNEDFGVIQVPVWDGDPYRKHLFSGPRNLTLTTTVFQRILNGQMTDCAPDASAAAAGDPPAQNQVLQPGILGGRTAGGFLGGAGTLVQFGSAGGLQPQGLNLNLLFPGANLGQQGAGGGGGGFTIANQIITETPLRLGLPGDSLDVLERTIVTVQVFAKAPSTPNAGGGVATGGGASNPRGNLFGGGGQRANKAAGGS